MRFVAALFLFCLIYDLGIWVTVAQSDSELASSTASTYDTKFDNIDLDEILKQERLLKNYVKCLEGKGPCTPDGKMLKETLPDAIETNCSKCSAKQKYGSEKVTRFLIDNRPDDWERLEKIYDPEGKYREEYLADKAAKAAKESEKEKV